MSLAKLVCSWSATPGETKDHLLGTIVDKSSYKSPFWGGGGHGRNNHWLHFEVKLTAASIQKLNYIWGKMSRLSQVANLTV